MSVWPSMAEYCPKNRGELLTGRKVVVSVLQRLSELQKRGFFFTNHEIGGSERKNRKGRKEILVQSVSYKLRTFDTIMCVATVKHFVFLRSMHLVIHFSNHLLSLLWSSICDRQLQQQLRANISLGHVRHLWTM